MRRNAAIFGFSLLSLLLPPTSHAKKSETPALIQELEAKYTRAGTLEARFSQTTESKATGTKKTSTGVLLVKKPNKIRWETKTPDPNLLVSDGKKFWFYTPPFEEGERGQVIEKSASEVSSQLANALISGSFSQVKGLRIEKKEGSRFILYPRVGTAGSVIRAELKVDLEKKLIDRILLEHKDGNRAEIRLENIELGKELDEKLFQFKAPPNTDRMDS